MSLTKQLVIIAGEESGDIHAAALVKKLRADSETYQFTGIGGKHLEAAGVDLISDLARYGVTGLSEVIRHARVIRQAFKAIKAHLTANKPDLLILVDYPGFNLRLAKFAKKKLNIRILYYISPQIWAWKANRIETIRACIDQMAVILPFEKKIYQQAGIAVAFVGHPLVENIPQSIDIESTRTRLNLPLNKRLIALLPGSRTNEILKHLPILVTTAILLSKQHRDLHFVIPVAGSLDLNFIKNYFINKELAISFIKEQARQVVACSDCVVVASGTASLECALLEKPMCIIYKSSWLTYFAATKVIKVKYLGLCNLLQNEMVVPELLQDDCNPIELTAMLSSLLTDEEFSNRMIRRLKKIKYSLSAEAADCNVIELVKSLL